MTRNIVEEHERDTEGEDVEVKMKGMMMKRLMVRGKEENVDLKEEDGILVHLQMMRDVITAAVKKDWRKRIHRTATKEQKQLEQKRIVKRQMSLPRKRQTSIIHC